MSGCDLSSKISKDLFASLKNKNVCFFKTNSEIDNILATQLLGIETGGGRSLTFNKAVLTNFYLGFGKRVF